MTANVVWIIAIIQRPAIRWRTSRSASSRDSESKRSASSPVRPIVLPSRIPETDSDSWTRLEMSASVSCVDVAILRRSLPTRLVRSTNTGISAKAKTDSCQLERDHADHRRDHRRHVRDDRRRGGRDDVLDAADVVRDARLHLARARAGEEREREPLQVAEHRRAQVVHDALADLVREQRLPDAEHARDDGDRDHPAGVDREASCRAAGSPGGRRAAGTPARRRAPPTRGSAPAPRPAEAGTAGRGPRSVSGSRGARPGRPGARAALLRREVASTAPR